MSPSLSSRSSAVVTGGAKGLGAEIARRLAARGHHVVIADLDDAAAATLADELGGRAVRLDVADADACLALAEDLPDLGVWVNNAGVLAVGPAWSTEHERRRLLVDVNLHGTMNGTTAALRRFLPAGTGHVLNVVSTAGITPAPHETVYGATKHAALAYSIGTALDLRITGHRGVHVSALCPDGMWTPMLHDLARDPDAWPSWQGGMMQPGDVADVAVRLLDRPRMVRVHPRWRGVLRVGAAFPGAAAHLLPAIVADARRRQRAFADRHPR
ncbi:SDR family oxidoreductase [Paraconexibacter algicola]|uniref:SDR family oxidoreductase n=1 Tax=Paraconexibacter algicola TaxID=2133960 RepID=UPI0018EEA3AF|nr:SDR family NAD(P)-dependent oxidoreductase [Paraconexibacter algicola]